MISGRTATAALILTLTSMLGSSPAQAQAKLEFETTIVDYGEIEQGSNGRRQFNFTNTGSEPLIISNARGSCGCLVPTAPKEPIPPGGHGVVSVAYNTNRIGPINKGVTVSSNAGQVTLSVRGTVRAKPAPGMPPSGPALR